MPPDTARAALLLAHRLVQRNGLTLQQALTAVGQVLRSESGPYTELVRAECRAALGEMAAAFRPLVEAMARQLAQAVAAAGPILRQFAEYLRSARPGPAAARRDRPAWQSPYGPPGSRAVPYAPSARHGASPGRRPGPAGRKGPRARRR
ncbi:hypothetical protein E0L36_22150 [Streptomyces sp. AJS327]|uniref:hypothetical protein n=1 Tax=Streptomyces sp. AJS327 TaxID=2545265 RepID=UPI0015E034DE|nr:hypothetical protein [Streptomyces sp. AJS327]MBA0053480.1 hypothetical protein [Streptomyces sp. AJS327]